MTDTLNAMPPATDTAPPLPVEKPERKRLQPLRLPDPPLSSASATKKSPEISS